MKELILSHTSFLGPPQKDHQNNIYELKLYNKNIKIETFRSINDDSYYYVYDTLIKIDNREIELKNTSIEKVISFESLYTKDILYLIGDVVPINEDNYMRTIYDIIKIDLNTLKVENYRIANVNSEDDIVWIHSDYYIYMIDFSDYIPCVESGKPTYYYRYSMLDNSIINNLKDKNLFNLVGFDVRQYNLYRYSDDGKCWNACNNPITEEKCEDNKEGLIMWNYDLKMLMEFPFRITGYIELDIQYKTYTYFDYMTSYDYDNKKFTYYRINDIYKFRYPSDVEIFFK